MVRDCTSYDMEYSECKAWRGRFHQHYTLGESRDCTAWAEDRKDCHRWADNQDVDALQRIVGHERVRMRERYSGHLLNNTWERRDGPPPEFTKTLPTHLQRVEEWRQDPLKKACVIS